MTTAPRQYLGSVSSQLSVVSGERSPATDHGQLATDLACALQSGQIWPGDCILYRYAHPSFVQRQIARIQQRAVIDYFRDTEDPIEAIDPRYGTAAQDAHLCYWQFTHAGMVLDAGRTVEMTSPRCRIIDWTARLQGVAEIAILRPAKATAEQLTESTWHAQEDARVGTRYPHRELLLYWLWSWSWRKLHGHTPFSVVFTSRKRNVCSGSVIDWWQRAEVDLQLAGLDTWPEAWYPARLLVDPRFQIVAHFSHESHERHEGTQETGDRNTHLQTVQCGTSGSPESDTIQPGSAVPPVSSPSCCSCDSWPTDSQGDQPVAPTHVLSTALKAFGPAGGQPSLLISSSPLSSSAHRQGQLIDDRRFAIGD